MPTDKENVSFLYSIIRQLETKHVSWKIVAHDNEITNDHAARMRFHRLRQHFEGLTPKKRGPRKGADGKGKCRAEFGDNASDEEDDDKGRVKRERKRKMCKTEESESEEDALAKHRAKKRSVVVKKEPGMVVKKEAGDGPLKVPDAKGPAAAPGTANGVALGAMVNKSPMMNGPDPLNLAMMRPANIPFGIAPRPQHFGYRPLMSPAHYRGPTTPHPGAPPMPGQQQQQQQQPKPDGSMAMPGGPPAPKPSTALMTKSPMVPQRQAMPGASMSGPSMSSASMSGASMSGPSVSGSSMSGTSMRSPPNPAGLPPKPSMPMSRMSFSGPPRSGPPPTPGLQMARMSLSGPPVSGPLPLPPSPLKPGQQQKMQDRMVSRPQMMVPLRPKNAHFERMPTIGDGDVTRSAENAAPPQMQRANAMVQPHCIHFKGNPNVGQGKPE